jgi:large subunit ribosomal protein L25
VSEVRIAAEPRTEFGKGAARRTRRAGKVPAVLYGHGADPVHLSLPGHELMLALKTPNVLLTLNFQGRNQLCLPKDVQRDPLKGFLEHVDLLLVRRGEKVEVEIPIQLTGEVVPGGLLTHELNTLPVLAEATNIPGSVEISIDGLPIGASVHASDVSLPAGVVLATEPDAVVIHIVPAPTAEQVEAELAGAEAEAGIEREAPTVPVEEEQPEPSEA